MAQMASVSNEDKVRQAEVNKEKSFQDLISKKASVLKEIYRLQSTVADLDTQIAQVAGTDEQVVVHW